MENIFATMATKIIKEQQSVIGPVALEVATKVEGLSVEKGSLAATLAEGREVEIMEGLVKGYQAIFGKASVEVCKDAVRDMLAKMNKDEIPSALQ